MPQSGRFARRNYPVGEVPIDLAIDVDRPFGEGHQHRRRAHADAARQGLEHGGEGEQPALVEQEGEEAEGADQPARLLAELAAAVEDARRLQRPGRQ